MEKLFSYLKFIKQFNKYNLLLPDLEVRNNQSFFKTLIIKYLVTMIEKLHLQD